MITRPEITVQDRRATRFAARARRAVAVISATAAAAVAITALSAGTALASTAGHPHSGHHHAGHHHAGHHHAGHHHAASHRSRAAVTTGAAPVGIADPDLIAQSTTTQASQLAAMHAMGLSSVRLDADWYWIQKAGSSSYDWAALDQAVSAAHTAGMTVDLIIDGCPPWAAVAAARGQEFAQPASAQEYGAFAGAVATRYAADVSSYEIWNEPNNASFWAPKPNAAAYTADLKAAYAAVKGADPTATVISGGLAPEVSDGTDISPIGFLRAMYADGAKGSFDALGYHPYSYPAMPDSYQNWSGWSQMAQTSPSLRSVMTANGSASTKIVITEVGAPSAGPQGVGQAGQATELTQAITAARADSWIGGIYLYTWQDQGTDAGNSEDWFGLLTASGAQTPAYTAVAAALAS